MRASSLYRDANVKTILMYPQARVEENYYLRNLSDVVSDEFFVVGVNELKKIRNIRFLFTCSVCHVNWLENVRSNNCIKASAQFFLRLSFLAIIKLLRKPLIWTVHNKQPHNVRKLGKLSHWLMILLSRWSIRIHVLCEATVNQVSLLNNCSSKIVCIPHGDYIDNYGKLEVDIKKRYHIDEKKKILFFVGKIGPYKNIDVLIKSFCQSGIYENDFVLLICGKCADEEYREYLESLYSKNKKYIYWDLNFISNAEMGDYLHQVDAMVLPYDIRSILNSGSAWMAFSYAKPIVCPYIGCLQDIQNLQEFSFIYKYDDEFDHVDKLSSCLKLLKNESTDTLKCKGQMAFQEMTRRSWKRNKERWLSLYKF